MGLDTRCAGEQSAIPGRRSDRSDVAAIPRQYFVYGQRFFLVFFCLQLDPGSFQTGGGSRASLTGGGRFRSARPRSLARTKGRSTVWWRAAGRREPQPKRISGSRAARERPRSPMTVDEEKSEWKPIRKSSRAAAPAGLTNAIRSVRESLDQRPQTSIECLIVSGDGSYTNRV